jgi:hypothetical protein
MLLHNVQFLNEIDYMSLVLFIFKDLIYIEVF